MPKTPRVRALTQGQIERILEHNRFEYHRKVRHGKLYFHVCDKERSALVPRDPVSPGALSDIITHSKKDREDFT